MDLLCKPGHSDSSSDKAYADVFTYLSSINTADSHPASSSSPVINYSLLDKWLPLGLVWMLIQGTGICPKYTAMSWLKISAVMLANRFLLKKKKNHFEAGPCVSQSSIWSWKLFVARMTLLTKEDVCTQQGRQEKGIHHHPHALYFGHFQPRAQPSLGLLVAPGDLVHMLLGFVFFPTHNLFPLSWGFKGQRLCSSSLLNTERLN